MVGDISLATRTEVLCAIRNRYAGASKMDKTKMLDEFVAMVGCHRKHAVRLLGQSDVPVERKVPMGQRIYGRGCQAGVDLGVGGCRQDLRQETEGRTTQAWSSP